MNNLTKEQAKQNLKWLVDTCVNKGGIFTDAIQVAVLINSIEVYGADHTSSETPALRAIPSAAEQLENRIKNSETQS
jgi:hypothetical protein